MLLQYITINFFKVKTSPENVRKRSRNGGSLLCDVMLQVAYLRHPTALFATGIVPAVEWSINKQVVLI